MFIQEIRNTFAPFSIDIYGDEWFTEQGTADKRGLTQIYCIKNGWLVMINVNTDIGTFGGKTVHGGGDEGAE